MTRCAVRRALLFSSGCVTRKYGILAPRIPHEASLAWSVSRIPHSRQGGLLCLIRSHAVRLAKCNRTDEGCSFRERIFTPAITIWIFLGQVLDQDHSCRQAVLRFVAWLSALGRSRCSSETGAYCRARQRLPEGVLARLARRRGSAVAEQS